MTDQTSDSTTPPAARRPRRAASRPAGPPVGNEAAESHTPAPETSPDKAVADKGNRQARRPRKTAPARNAASVDANVADAVPSDTVAAEPVAEKADRPAKHKRPAKKTAVKAPSAVVEAEDAATAPVPLAAVFQAPAADKPQRAQRNRNKQEETVAQTDSPSPEIAGGSDTETSSNGSEERRNSNRRNRNRNQRDRERAANIEETTETEAEATDDGEAADEHGDSESQSSRRRRRRGGRRRRKGSSHDGHDVDDSDDSDGEDSETVEGEESGSEDSQGEQSSSRRRRRRSGSGSGSSDDNRRDETPVRGSTRLEAKKQRRREGREAGRRRAPILSEAEYLARRENVNRVMAVREAGDRVQIAVLEDGVLVEHYVNRHSGSSLMGNVYLGRVQNVLPSMEAAFVDIGKGRNAVLYAGEVNWDAAGLEGEAKRIEHAFKVGDPVLVQVTKDPIGHKGARLTAQISLAGRFVVYVPDGSMTGISRKLPDRERNRLKTILRSVLPEEAGVIVRTAAEGASEDDLTRDVARLTAQWDDIAAKAKTAAAPALLYSEPDLAIRVVRDIFNEDFAELVVAGDTIFETLEQYITHVAPDLAPRLRKWVDSKDLYGTFRIDEQLAKALDRKVWLPSGGSLVIDRTEAMTVVDVNTGKFTGEGGNLEQTVTRNNLEAAEEIVRQLRLRDIGGIIVIDFIDMVLESNRDLVLRRLVECLGRDRTKHQVAEVTSLGLVQMTRKRLGQGLLETFSEPCEHCHSRGVRVKLDVASAKADSGENHVESEHDHH